MPDVSNFILLNVPLENDYKHTLYFASESAQETFFKSKTYRQVSDVTYIRQNHPIRVNGVFDSLISNCNYVMYQNLTESGKWYYAFITEMKYIDEGRTDVYIETDCIQTWLFDYRVKTSFVEREHVIDDTVGANTVPEGLETGEFICMGSKYDAPLLNTELVLGTTVDSAGNNVQGGNYNGIYSAIKYYCGTPAFINSMVKLLTEGDDGDFKGGKADAINCVFMAPTFLTGDNDSLAYISNSNSVKTFTSLYAKPTKINTYTPRNKKLLTFPYSYLLVSNNNGGSAVYRYEDFNQTNCEFTIEGAITPGCSIRLIPKNYKALTENNEEGLNLGKYPICNWATDVYTNWLTQNSVNIALDLVSGGIQVVGGVGGAIATGGVGGIIGVGSAISGVEKIAGTLAQVHTQSFTPPQSKGNINCGDVITAGLRNTFTYYQMCIKTEYARIIDEYFDMFGYKVNRVKVPNKAHRSKYWYTKTIDVNIDGPVPNKDMQVIKNCYNNGITFWRNASEIQDYSVSNVVV